MNFHFRFESSIDVVKIRRRVLITNFVLFIFFFLSKGEKEKFRKVKAPFVSFFFHLILNFK